MKDKLIKIGEALTRYSNPDIQNQHNYKATMGVDDTIVAQEALTLLYEILAEFESGLLSDGFHTFNELYEHRHILFATLVADNDEISWKSLKHADGSMFEGWFIAGMDILGSPVTYHIPIRLWDLFKCKKLENAPKWDGHTSEDVVKRFQAAINTIVGKP